MPGTLNDLARLMRGLDLCLLTTTTAHGLLGSRPMSNNGEVDYDGTSHFFTWSESRAAQDIAKNKNVQLGFQSQGPFLFIAVQGDATLTTHRPTMAPHWQESLTQWFKDGLDTPGLTMITVRARRVNWWGEEEGELELG
ncbi:pyridoxamine 5'-phosphate oxidase family protein [Deinococcus actinosclerus]|uniref:Pyridoxamine 5'-phosphate oxidase n=1 Tax=Deinococcus actinosclerus TaxID=1768108 RepID=A0ABM5X2Z8_9DEIO|nr:pyridoxamine 5'-phosphate oxidase family protein [Deinococcus actinosclerus]ALW88046.1 pyridoxamine 5'-phosphate oxidase [Deinococcus actinosclerus]